MWNLHAMLAEAQEHDIRRQVRERQHPWRFLQARRRSVAALPRLSRSARSRGAHAR